MPAERYIEYSHSAKRKSWKKENESCWSQKSKLEKYLVILLVISMTTLIGSLGYLYFFNPKENQKICETPGCILAAAQIVSQLDTKINPCQDFFKFVCHKQSNKNKKLSESSLVERQLNEIAQEPISEDDHVVIKRRKKFFQACMNETAVHEEILGRFKDTLKKLDGWPVVVGYFWVARRFDWKDMIYELKNLGYDFTMMMSIGVSIDPNNTNQYIFAVVEPAGKQIKNEHKEQYRKYMTEVAIYFGADRKLATLEMIEVVEFMEKLFMINHNTVNENGAGGRMTVQEFQDEHNEMDWLDFINTLIFPSANISFDDYVYFPNSKRMEEITKLIHKTSKRTQANYIIWSVLESIMPFMPEEIRQLGAYYSCAMEKSSEENRFKLCKNLLKESFFPVATDKIYAKKHFSLEKQRFIQGLFEHIKSSSVRMISESSLLEKESKDHIVERLETLNAIIAFEEDFSNETLSDLQFIDKLDQGDVDNSFFTMFLKCNKRKTDAWYSLVHQEVNVSVLESFINGVRIMYYKPSHILLVPAGILEESYDMPMYLNYATTVYQLGKAITEALFEVEGDVIQNQTNCINQQVKNIGFEESELDASQVIDYLGSKMAYEAYKMWLQENEEARLPSVEQTPFQLFWVALASSRCNEVEDKQTKANAAMQSDLNFREDFECEENVAANPLDKCGIL